MADTAKQLKRGYKRNQKAIAALLEQYYKATGKTALKHSASLKTDTFKPTVTAQGQGVQS